MAHELGKLGRLTDEVFSILENDFGAVDARKARTEVYDVYVDFGANIYDWATRVRQMMFWTAPYASGNLRDSLSDEVTDNKAKTGFIPSSAWAGIDTNRMLSGTRKTYVKNPKHPWRGYAETLPSFDYTEMADARNWTANHGLGGPFIEETWFEQADLITRKEFK